MTDYELTFQVTLMEDEVLIPVQGLSRDPGARFGDFIFYLFFFRTPFGSSCIGSSRLERTPTVGQ